MATQMMTSQRPRCRLGAFCAYRITILIFTIFSQTNGNRCFCQFCAYRIAINCNRHVIKIIRNQKNNKIFTKMDVRGTSKSQLLYNTSIKTGGLAIFAWWKFIFLNCFLQKVRIVVLPQQEACFYQLETWKKQQKTWKNTKKIGLETPII